MGKQEKASEVINLIPFYRECENNETDKDRKDILSVSDLRSAEVSSTGVLFVGGEVSNDIQVFDISKLENFGKSYIKC